MPLKLKGHLQILTVLTVYGPALDADNGMKETSYMDVKKALIQIFRGDVLIIAWSWNEQLGLPDSIARKFLGSILGRP